MLVLNAADVRALAPMGELIERLRVAFGSEGFVPPRQIACVPGGDGRYLFSMPAFTADGVAAVKLVSLFPDNGSNELPTIQGVVVVFDEHGTPVAVLDGATVTRLRTSAASALASSYLSRDDSVHHVIIGTGSLAPFMALAHSTVRPIRKISLCGRTPEDAKSKIGEVQAMVGSEIEVVAATTTEEAVAEADIVTCVTNSPTPVLHGKWLKLGAFVDLIGSFTPSRRESDDDVVLRSRIFVDTFEGAMSEAGDLLDPIERGIIDRRRIEGELADLVTGRVQGRANDEEIILFKSVGTAIEDLAAARLVVENRENRENQENRAKS